MGRSRKIISAVLALVLILNLAGIDAAAGETAGTGKPASLTEMEEETDNGLGDKGAVSDSVDSAKNDGKDNTTDGEKTPVKDTADDKKSDSSSTGGDWRKRCRK